MFINTLNNMGYQAEKMDLYSMLFVENAAQLGKQGHQSLEIGCGYGVAAVSAIKAGAKLYCNDLDQRHLDVLEKKLEVSERNNCHMVSGDFRFADFESSTLVVFCVAVSYTFLMVRVLR
ncbi:MAG: class I SAM-dependent methyltransferase [Coxiellaceae bacterium]|nr:class I SAM-dependent methyltransferase [Coxiellaceae bacterium]